MPVPTVGLAIAAIPCRPRLLTEALASVCAQHLMPDQIAVELDCSRSGAAPTRNRAWRRLTTDYVAFLDDDDLLKPWHLERLIARAEQDDADLVYPWFFVEGGTDPFPDHYGRPWDPASPCQTTITCLWKRTALEAVGGFPTATDGLDQSGHREGEDFLAVRNLNNQGGKIVHLAERTWTWRHHGGNTSGMPDRW